MIPTLYDKTGTIKIGDLTDCIECLVEEERNGIFELTLVYPSASDLLDCIITENIVICDANDFLKQQKFRIYNTRKLMANRIEVCARHISFDLAHDWIDKIEFENQSCEYALNQIFRNSQFCKHFRGYSDIINAQDFKVDAVSCLSAIGGAKGSVLDTFGNGAEVLRDNTEIHVLNRRGHDNDVSIEYRKNLTGFELEEDTTDLVTRILPYAKYYDQNKKNEEVVVKGAFVDSPNIDNYVHPYIKYIDYSEKFDDDNLPNAEKLERLAKKEYAVNKVDVPKQNYKIEFVPLSKCAGYEDLEDRINLCDVVTIRDTRYNIDTQSKVIKVTYDVLRDRYESMELGEPRTTLGDIVSGGGINGPIKGEQGPPGANGDLSDFPDELPETPIVSTTVYGFANVEISWTFEGKIYYTYEVYASKTKGFTPNVFDLIFSGQASTFMHQLKPNETWYYKVCAVNTHGSRTDFSEEVEVNTVKIDDLSNYVEEMAISDALIGELNLGRGWYGELRGNYIDARQLSVTDGNGKRTLDIDSFGNVRFDVQEMKIKGQSAVTFKSLSTPGETAIDGANITTGYLSADRISGGVLSSKNKDLIFNLNSGILGVYENSRLLCTTLKMRENKSGKYGMGILANNDSFIALGLGDNDDNTIYKPYMALANEITGTDYHQGINLLTTVHGFYNSLKNMGLTYDGFKRSNNDYVSIYPTNLNSSESKLIMELGDDYTTSFEILAKMYNKGYSDRVATFRGVGGSEENPASQAGIHFYQNLDMHGYRIWGLNNLSANDASVETLKVSEISIEPTVAVAADNGKRIKYTVPTAMAPNIEFFGSGTVIDGYCVIELPEGFYHDGYIVVVSPMKSGYYEVKKHSNHFEVMGDIDDFDYIVKGSEQ